MPTTQEQLIEAETALHKLRIGGATVSVGYGDRTVTYSKANIGDLKRYIAELKAALAGKPAPARNRVRYAVPD